MDNKVNANIPIIEVKKEKQVEAVIIGVKMPIGAFCEAFYCYTKPCLADVWLRLGLPEEEGEYTVEIRLKD